MAGLCEHAATKLINGPLPVFRAIGAEEKRELWLPQRQLRVSAFAAFA